MKKHLIFDFDDTLSSSRSFNWRIFLQVFLNHWPDIDQDFLKKLHFEKTGQSMVSIFQEAVNKFSLPLSAETLAKENDLLQQKNAAQITFFENINDLLSHFKKRGKIISICTNRDKKSIQIALKKNRLSPYLDNVISCTDEGHEKPDPFCLLELMDQYPQVTPGQTIYFGDSSTDTEFATRAGIDFLIINQYLNKELFYRLILESFADAEDATPLKR